MTLDEEYGPFRPADISGRAPAHTPDDAAETSAVYTGAGDVYSLVREAGEGDYLALLLEDGTGIDGVVAEDDGTDIVVATENSVWEASVGSEKIRHKYESNAVRLYAATARPRDGSYKDTESIVAGYDQTQHPASWSAVRDTMLAEISPVLVPSGPLREELDAFHGEG